MGLCSGRRARGPFKIRGILTLLGRLRVQLEGLRSLAKSWGQSTAISCLTTAPPCGEN
jgi:hypothetical protein